MFRKLLSSPSVLDFYRSASPAGRFRQPCLLAIAILSFLTAWEFPAFGFLILAHLAALVLLSQGTSLSAFYSGFSVGMAVYAVELQFFWTLFGPASVILWAVLAFWLGSFVKLSRELLRRFPPAIACVLVPLCWMGLEYFRGELYPLRFTWFVAGGVFSGTRLLQWLGGLGVYGIGTILMAAALTLLQAPWKLSAPLAGLLCVVLLALSKPATATTTTSGPLVRVAGLQLEFPVELELPQHLDRLIKAVPEAQLLVLSENTIEGTVPKCLREWCRRNGRYLILGGREPAGGDQFRNTAFVIDPRGEIVFRQAKSVPIQFFNDGLPALRQQLWESPWGPIGLAICYDLSYRRVIDELVHQGATALIVPAMDVREWGEKQHRLHAKIAPLRAAEYRIPVFRVASSGISQAIEPGGRSSAATGFPGQGEVLRGTLSFRGHPTMPFDHWLAPPAAWASVFGLVWILCPSFRRNGSQATAPYAKRSSSQGSAEFE